MSTILKSYRRPPQSMELLRRCCTVSDRGDGRIEEVLSFLRQNPELKPFALKAYGHRQINGVYVESNMDQTIRASGLGVMMREVSLQALTSLLEDELAFYSLPKSAFVERSGAVAIWMEELAGILKRDPTKHFVLGQLHALGMVPINRLMHRIKPFTRLESSASVSDQVRAERRECNGDFCAVGADLLERWGFPEDYVYPVRNQLHPALCPRYRETAVLLNLSVNLADLSLEGLPTLPMNRMPENLMREIGLETVDIAATMSHAGERIRKMSYRMQTDAAFA